MSRATPDTKIATRKKIHSLLKRLDRHHDADQAIVEDREPEFLGRAGLVHPANDGPITVLCEIDGEVIYFQGGLVFCAEKGEFFKLVGGPRKFHSHPPPSQGKKLTRMELELILGVLSAVEPIACWTILGSDIFAFIEKNKENLKRWNLQIGSLLLAQKFLKKFAGKLYRKISAILTDGGWARISAFVPTDDASIARFSGYLLGYYGSGEFLQRVIDARWSISFHLIKGLESVANSRPKAGKAATAQDREDVARSFGKLGVQVSSEEVLSFLEEIESRPDVIKKAMEILGAAFPAFS